MRKPTNCRHARWDAPFCAGVLLATFGLGSVACFGRAAAIALGPQPELAIVAVDDGPPAAKL